MAPNQRPARTGTTIQQWCTSTLTLSPHPRPATPHTIPRAETCGGTDAFDLYKLEWPDAPVNHPEYMECYADMKSDRVMGHKTTTDDMTPAVCREHCMGKDAMYYGTQVSVCMCACVSSFFVRVRERCTCKRRRLNL